jgi:hypothetical protein
VVGAGKASEGRRQLTWSTGRRDLRKLAGLGAEATDEDIAAEDLEADTRLELPAEAWDCVQRGNYACELLSVAENGGLGAVRSWLTGRGLFRVEHPQTENHNQRPHRPISRGVAIHR